MAKKTKSVKSGKDKLLPVKQNSQGLVLVQKEKFKLSKIYEKKAFKETVKTVSFAIIAIIFVIYIMLLMLATTSIFYVSHLKSGLIQRGVFISEIDISGMSKEEAKNYISQEINNNISEKIFLKYNENIYELTLSDIELQFDIDSAVNEAYAIGRTKNVVKDLWDYAKVINDTVNIDLNIKYNEEALNQFITQIAEILPNKVQAYTYEIQNNVLVINRGKSGINLNHEELKRTIISNLENRKFNEVIELPVYEELPKDIDLRKNT